MTLGQVEAPEPVGYNGPRWLGLPTDRRQLRARALRDGLLIAGWMASVFILVVIPAVGRSLGYDAYSYWFADLHERYVIAGRGIYELGAFRYAPPIGTLFSWFSVLPWWLFVWLWSALLVASLIWLGGRRTLFVLALPPVALELYHGNIHILMAVAIALGFRYPVAWSFVILTKVTPGIGLVWFAVRREWRSLGIALGATAVIAASSYLAAPTLWADWLATLALGASRPADLGLPPPLIVRLPLAVLIVAWGARTDRAWTVAVGAMLALPNLWPHGLVVALGALPFLRRGDPDASGTQPSAARYTTTVGMTLLVAAVIAVVFASPLERVIWLASGAVMAAAGIPPPR